MEEEVNVGSNAIYTFINVAEDCGGNVTVQLLLVTNIEVNF